MSGNNKVRTLDLLRVLGLTRMGERSKANVDIFGDGSVVAAYTFENNARDVVGDRHGIWSGADGVEVEGSYAQGKTGMAAHFDPKEFKHIYIGHNDYSDVKAVSIWYRLEPGKFYGNFGLLHGEAQVHTFNAYVWRQAYKNRRYDGMLITSFGRRTKLMDKNDYGSWRNMILQFTDKQILEIYIHGEQLTRLKMNLRKDERCFKFHSIGSLVKVLKTHTSPGATGVFKGEIDNILMFDRSLTPEEIQQIVNS